MEFTTENIHSLEYIIYSLNTIEDEDDKKKFLNGHVEDMDLFLNTIKKINKSKLPKPNKASKKIKEKDTEHKIYNEEDIYTLFQQKNDETIMQEYSLSDLKGMYASIYKRKATSNYTKEKILSTLRNRMYTMDRAAAFSLMPK